MRPHPSLSIAAGTATLLLACRFATDLSEPLGPLEQAVRATATALAPTPTPTRLPRIACPVPVGSPILPDLSNPSQAAGALTDYLNQGGTPDALRLQLEDLDEGPVQGDRLAQADFNGDGWLDVAVSVIAPSPLASLPGGTLYAFVCNQDRYQLAFTTASLPEQGAPVVHAAQDMNGDQSAELLIGIPSCGASTCFEAIEALAWSNGTLVDLLRGQTDDLPFPQIELTPAGAPGVYDIRVTATGIGSVGAGPFQPRTRTWSWQADVGAFVKTAEETHPTNFRIHRLYAADRAAASGHFAKALDLYNEVIHNPALEDWVNPEAERGNLAAYARFRRILTLLQVGDLDQARSEYGDLQASFPPGAPGRAYAEMAEAFWTEFQSTSNLARGCERAQAYAVTHAATTLDPLYFGYANPSYNAMDLCPLQ